MTVAGLTGPAAAERQGPGFSEPGPRRRGALADRPRVKPRLRGALHQAAFFAALGAGPTLVGLAPSGRAALPLAVYAISLAALFGLSALYHRPDWAPRPRLWMRRLDHCGIFLMIAGSYTPICTLALRPPKGPLLLAAVWTGAAAGMLQALLWTSAPKWAKAAIYIALGWLAAWALPELAQSVGTTGLVLMFGGGLAYTAGALVYARRWPDPVPAVFGYHEVFHALVVLAAVCHFAMVVRLIR